MKKIILSIVILILILIIPIKKAYYDGGTKTYTSLTYKIIVWHETMQNQDRLYKTGTEYYFFPNNFHELSYYKDPVPDDLYITVNDNTEKMFANLGSYCWSKKAGNKTKSVCADAIGPTIMDYNNTITVKIKDKLYLSNKNFDISEVKLYDDNPEEQININIKYDNDEKYIIVPNKKGTYFMTIDITSNNGTAWYSIKLNIK